VSSISFSGLGTASAGPDPHKSGDHGSADSGSWGRSSNRTTKKSKKELILPSLPKSGMRSSSHTDKLVFEKGSSVWLFQVEKGLRLWLVEHVEHKSTDSPNERPPTNPVTASCPIRPFLAAARTCPSTTEKPESDHIGYAAFGCRFACSCHKSQSAHSCVPATAFAQMQGPLQEVAKLG
jgi:hypothetical protein